MELFKGVICAYCMNWAEGTGPLTLSVFNRREEKLRQRMCATVRVDELIWSLYDADRPQWWTHHAKAEDEVFNDIAA